MVFIFLFLFLLEVHIISCLEFYLPHRKQLTVVFGFSPLMVFSIYKIFYMISQQFCEVDVIVFILSKRNEVQKSISPKVTQRKSNRTTMQLWCSGSRSGALSSRLTQDILSLLLKRKQHGDNGWKGGYNGMLLMFLI